MAAAASPTTVSADGETMGTKTESLRTVKSFLRRSHILVAWVALVVSLWSLYSVKSAQPAGDLHEPQMAPALSAPPLPLGCGENSAAASSGRNMVSLDVLPPGSTGWTTSWSVALDRTGKAFLPPHITVSEAPGGTATTLVVKDRAGAVSVIQCEPQPIPSDPDLYAGGAHLDVGGPGWQPVTLTVPACLTYQIRAHGVMQAEDCGSIEDPSAVHTGETAPKYAVELQIKDMRPDTSGWTQPWAAVRDRSGDYFIDRTFALDMTRRGNAELRIVKGRDGLLTACPDSAAASQIGPQDGYQVKADLPIAVIHVEQEAPCTRTN